MKVLIFGGTTEGRKLSSLFVDNNIEVVLFVATEYGRDILPLNDKIKVFAKRLNKDEMIYYLKENLFDYVVDTTHPYANIVTQNIRSACEITNTKYIRLIREKNEEDDLVTYVSNVEEAVSLLKDGGERALLTIGSKELEHFTKIKDFSSRFYVRILPMMDSLKKAIDLGFKNENIICMQGPFDIDLNKAMIKMISAKYLVTKDSGDAGGFQKKVSAALELNCKVIVIKRPTYELGYTYEEILQFFKVLEEIKTEKIIKKAFFPLFLNLQKRKVLFVGGGRIAERRISIIESFGAELTLISPAITDGLDDIIKNKGIKFINRKFQYGDIKKINPFLVIAATNSREVNKEILKEAEETKTLHIIADCKEECDCYFPAVAESNSYIAGIVSKDGNHLGVSETAKKLRSILQDE